MTAGGQDDSAAGTGLRHRLFFAMVPPPAVRHRVHVLQRRLKCGGRAVRPPNLHVTLAFLGMQEAAVIAEAAAVAADLEFPPCRVTLDRVGQFGRGSVLWLGATAVPDELHAFQQALVAALTRQGIGHDPKPWKLHLTLYRRLRKRPPTLDSVAIEWRLDGFDLIESIGAKNGVEYHSLGHWDARV
ncbi:MAG: RNA 2',3'-cyclic phosphodiesterase [Xanthomonadales bacterium]|nr:RNA 2',3'-cyclic phosphodiesterase [Xanthomonadales bacterium]